MHRVSVEAKDSSGNIGRASQSYHEDGSGMTSFVDTGNHWAGSYAEYLYDRGVLGGELVGNFRYFYPERNLSRAEFAKMISNYLGLDLSQYSGVELPLSLIHILCAPAGSRRRRSSMRRFWSCSQRRQARIFLSPHCGAPRTAMSRPTGNSRD